MTVIVAKVEVGEKIEKIVTAVGGKAGRMIELGKKQLAYPIKKLTEAIFLSWTVDLDPTAVLQLQHKLTVDKDVVRHLLIRVEA